MIKLFTARRIILFIIFAFIVIASAVFSNQQDTIPVLNYHLIEDNVRNPLALSNQDFEKQMAYLQEKGYSSITPDQLVAHLKAGAPLPDKPILITFDDGYRDNYVNAYPIMKKYGFTGTVFLITDVVGHDNWYLDWDQVREMHKGGFVFGSHTLSHVSLTAVTPDEAFHQLIRSKEGIEWRLDAPVKYFAYPTGTYSDEIQELVKKSGYEGAFTVDFGRVSLKSDVYALERIPIFKSRYTFYDFYLRLNCTVIVEQVKAVVRPFWHMLQG